MSETEIGYGEKRFTWIAREVVKELDKRPHLLIRLEIRGGGFIQRAMQPVVRIVTDERTAIESWFGEVSNNGDRIVVYFPEEVPDRGVLLFGYYPEPTHRLVEEFDARRVRRLDRARLPEGLVVVTPQFLAERG